MRPERSRGLEEVRKYVLKNIIKIIRCDWGKVEGFGNVRREGKKVAKRIRGIRRRRKNINKMIIQHGRISKMLRYSNRGGLCTAKGMEIPPELERVIGGEGGREEGFFS